MSKDKWQAFAEKAEKEAIQESPEPDDEKSVVVDEDHLLGEENPDVMADNALRDKIGLLEREILGLKDQCLRLQAESKNTLTRMEQEVAKARKFGIEKIVAELVPVAESLARGLESSVSDDSGAKLIRQGSELTLEMLHKLLEKNGVTVINPAVGDPFDPMQHEAMSMVPNPDAKSNTILQVLQKGYALHGRVIKAAMVMVVA